MLASAPDPEEFEPRARAHGRVRAFRFVIVVSGSLVLLSCAGPDLKRTPPRIGTTTAEAATSTQSEVSSNSSEASEPTALEATGATLIGEAVFEGQPPAGKQQDMKRRRGS
jgi:hypothetical protein